MVHESQKRIPYVGPRHFEKQDKGIFFGRDREMDDIFSLIIARRTLLLYAQSGAGKTSLINAGVIPLLEGEGFEVFPVTRVRGGIPREMLSQMIPNIYVFNILMSWGGEDADPKQLSQMSIASFLAKRKHTADEEGNDLPRIVIFDQFEELFSFYPERWKEREEFFRQMAEAIEADPLLRVLFVIREDYLASLISYADFLPGKLRVRYRLERLNDEGACLAVQGPLQGTECSFAEGVASSLVQKLLNIRVESTSGDMTEVPSEYVEPVQLQVVCQKLWNSLKPNETVIKFVHLEKYGDVDKALRGFYENAINITKKETGVKERALREWFSKKLITPDLTRGTVFQGKESTVGIPNSAVDVLDHQYIIRAEITKGGRWYELTHDRLIGPIQKSNDDWFMNFRKYKARTRILQSVGLLIVLLGVFLPLGVWLRDRVQEENRRTFGQIEKLRRDLEEGNRYINAENTIDNVVSYLWTKQGSRSFAKLVNLLKESEDLIPEDYGVDVRAGYVMPFVDEDVPWPLVLEYNPKRNINRGQLQYQWRYFAINMAESWGINVPMRLKLRENTALPEESMRVLVPATLNGKSQAGAQTEGADEEFIERKLSVPSLLDHIVFSESKLHEISESKLSERLLTFFNNNKRNWTLLEQLEFGGPWWIMPRWTHPLWKAAGHNPSTQEGIIAVALANKLIHEPELVLNLDSVEYLLNRVIRKSWPRTVDEAFAARDGIGGVLRDLTEVVRQGYPLSRLQYILDSLAKYPAQYFNPLKAAEEAIADQGTLDESYLPHLTGQRPLDSTVLRDEKRSGPNFRHVYEEIRGGFPQLEPEVRVYLGRHIFERVVTLEDELTPELLEALEDLRGKIYGRFGIIGPFVKFRKREYSLEDDQFRIEIVNQTKSDENAQPISISPDQALERLHEELRFRYVAFRKWWLTTERVYYILQDLPEYLRKWLEDHYTLTDIKMILRAVIMPSKPEIDIYTAGGSGEDANHEILSEQTISYPTWLLGSLAFWRNVSNPLDAEQIASDLRKTQKARLFRTQAKFQSNKATEIVMRGIKELENGRIESAAEYFKEAVKLDRNSATQAFPALYSQLPQIFLKGRLARLENLYLMPAPGKVSVASELEMQARYELEDFLSHFGGQISPESRRKFQLHLIRSYLEEKHYKKSENLLNQLLSHNTTEHWISDEEYFLAYIMLDANMQAVTPPERLGQIQNLLLSVFERWSKDLHAELAFRELTELYTKIRAPTWYLSMLESLADLHKQNYWISYMMGSNLATGVNLEEGKKALAMLDRAESNLLKIKPNNRARLRAWLNLHRAQAYLTLAEYGEQRIREQAWKQALGLLTSLIDSVQPGAQGWPPLYWVYRYVADAYIWANDIEQAAIEVDKGLHRFPDNQELLYEKFFLHLAQIQTNEAVKLAQELLDGPRRDEPHVLFLPALAQVLTGKGEFEYAARRFLYEVHPYRDYIRMMLYWSLCKEGKDKEAKELLNEYWRTIDPLSWDERMKYGDKNVWSEMLIGYYIGKVDRNDIFGPLQNRGTFERSPLRQIGFSFSGIRCEAHFYNALLQGVSGNPETRRDRQLKQLKMVLDTQHFSYYEYHMANYLINIL